MQLNTDSRIVMTLDAGGTNLRFSAMRGNQLLFEPIPMPSEADNLTRCLANIVEGFTQSARGAPSRRWRSASPSPARPIIRRASSATWATCPASAAASPWGRCWKNDFGLPDFINNDGDLFVYGEAICRLPALRQRPAQGRRQPETVQEPVRRDARHRLRRRHRPRRRAVHRRQRGRRRNLGARAASCTTAASSKRTSASAPCSGSTRNTRR